MELSLGLAFAAGVISFASPCVLALVPVYLAYLGETAASVTPAAAAPGSSTGAAGSAVGRVARQPVLRQVALFILSFALIFVVLGTSVGLLGASLFRLVPFAREAAGIVVIALGVITTGVFGPLLSRVGWRLPVERLPEGRSARSIALGALFAVGWSPCIGPVLGAILAMGASSQQVGIAALLLAFYGLGLAAPFLAAALALPQLTPAMTTLRRWHRQVEVLAGLFIVLMGVLIYSNAFARMAGLFTWFL